MIPTETRGSFRTEIVTLLILWAVLFLGHGWEPGLKMDGMTNSILAKHILSSGDWAVLHYTPSGYPDYYPHPPFSIWAEALFFKWFGISDFTARLCASVFGLGTLAGVFYWATLGGSLWEGFVAVVILLTSSRYIKYASDAFLEGPLAFWLVWGGIAFLKAREWGKRSVVSSHPSLNLGFSLDLLSLRSRLLWFAFGLCVGFAFLTKSVFALSLPIGLLVSEGSREFSLLCRNQKSSMRDLILGLVPAFLGVVLVLIAWFYLGDGISFLKNHWVDIRDRVKGGQTLLQHLDPILNLLRTYLPWFPIFFFCCLKGLRKLDEIPIHTRAALFTAGVILAGLTYSGFFFEHYLVPFYPMAALTIAPWVARRLASYRIQILEGIHALAILIAVLLAVFPIRLHSAHTEPLTEVLEEIQGNCAGQKEVLVSQALMEKWMALAVILWKLPVDASSVDVAATSAHEGQLLIADSRELPNHVDWSLVPLRSTPVKLYQPKKFAPLCR